jgi:hypothetical protein
MKVYTLAEARTKVMSDMDVEDEDFIDAADVDGFFNEAIDEAEAIIMNLRQDYFFKSAPIALVAGQQNYDMPSDIYSNKIRMLFYDNGSRQYKLDYVKLERREVRDRYGDTDDYGFSIENVDADTGPQIKLHPPSREDSADNLKIFYIRNANRVENDTDKIDIPEFINYIWAYVRRRIAEEEANPLLANYIANEEKQEARMKQTLDEMVLDNDRTIDPDMSFYDEFNHEDYWGDY